jgi:hypothetical protein
MVAEIILFHPRDLNCNQLLDIIIFNDDFIFLHSRRKLHAQLLAKGDMLFLLCLFCIISQHLKL